MTATTAYIALGANTGDRRGTLEAALDDLRATDGVEVVTVAGFIETAPEGPPDQPPYLNSAAEIHTCLEPRRPLVDEALLLETVEPLHHGFFSGVHQRASLAHGHGNPTVVFAVVTIPNLDQ